MLIGLISHPDCLQYPVPEQHPEQPARIKVIQDLLIAKGLDILMPQTEAPLASPEELKRAHTAEYVDHIFELGDKDEMSWLDQDTPFTAQTLQAARRSAGACIKGVDLAIQGPIRQQFCLVRPPGHHAERNRAMGFCIFNNIAVGAAHALEHYQLERIAILDFDVHHGNGTEDIFKDDPRVLFCSAFQYPFYPEMPFITDRKNIVNVPLPAYTRSKEFREAITKRWIPAIDEFSPQLILVSAGFDGHSSDDMAQFMLADSDYGWLSSQLIALAEKHADNRMVAVLEGGYNTAALATSVLAYLQAYWD